jgi:aspartokinase/homoserine dehydrogenase 1
VFNGEHVKVMKFGGSSVADAARIRAVVDIVAEAASADRIILVFSAMKGITDQLLSAADQAATGNPAFRQLSDDIRNRHLEVINQLLRDGGSPAAAVGSLCDELADLLHGVSLVRECSPRTRDLIVSHGERLNCITLTAVLSQAGLNARMIDGRDIVRTDSAHGSAAVDFKSTYALMRHRLSSDETPGDASNSVAGNPVAGNPVAIVTGFIASDANGVTTTLGRNGSDYTASLVGAAMDAETIEIWTDVDGVYSADPRFVKSATVIDSVSYREAMELSYFGAEVIHPFTMLPAVEKGIPLLIKNTMNPSAPGTVIAEHTSAQSGLITGIASIESVALINIEGGGMVGLPGIAGRVFSALAETKINIIMISQASSEHSICFVVRDHEAGPAVSALENELELELHQKKIEQVQVERDLEIVAVIGENMKGRPGISGRLFGALGEAGINVLAIAQGSTEMNISFVVPRRDRKKALNAVHRAFFPGDAQ